MSWPEENQAYLVARIEAVGEHLDRLARGEEQRPPSAQVQAVIESTAEPLAGSSSLERLTETFGLSDFEEDLLVLLAAVELDSSFAARFAAASGDHHLTQPTFGLSLSALPEPHWSALSPSRPLRYWRMVEIGPSDALTAASLRLDERILHYLAGIDFIDDRLGGFVEPVATPAQLVPSQHDAVRQVLDVWTHLENGAGGVIVQLTGPDAKVMAGVAASAASHLGMELWQVIDVDIPPSVTDRESLVRLWEREAALSGRTLAIRHGDSESRHQAAALANTVRGLVVLAGRDGLELRDRPTVRIEVGRPTLSEQLTVWNQSTTGPLKPPQDSLEAVVRQFDLGVEAILAAALDYTSRARTGEPEDLGEEVWGAALRQSRPQNDSLAQRVAAVASWDDLVLPDTQMETLRQIAAHVRHRPTVYDDWGFADRESRGLGITALFSGRSGTGKTMAAEVLANELRLDLYRIDLSSVVSKYIGETEKNLRRVFDAAEVGGSILLFDEADALFGKRSEVKDSHDRYANIEVSYLLQRMEAYRGLAILTTNIREAVDPAFMRRIRFSIDFEFPDEAMRERIWQRVYPTATPTTGLEPATLARLTATGGDIRNIALNAAFRAAEDGAGVSMDHLARAAHDEFFKLDRNLSDVDLGGWS